MWKCQVLILWSDARDWMCYEELRAFCEWDRTNPLPLLPLCFLLIEQLQLHCLFCYLLPKIYPCVFRSSMRIHCYLTIDNRRGCLLRSWPAWCFVVVVLWIFFVCWSLNCTTGNIFAWRPLTVLWRGCGVQLRCCGLQAKPRPKEPKIYPAVGQHQRLTSWWTDSKKPWESRQITGSKPLWSGEYVTKCSLSEAPQGKGHCPGCHISRGAGNRETCSCSPSQETLAFQTWVWKERDVCYKHTCLPRLGPGPASWPIILCYYYMDLAK